MPVESVGPVEPAQPVGSVMSVGSAVPVASGTDATQPPQPGIRLRVSRVKKGDPRSHFDDFEVGIEPDATVLDALLLIRRRQDPTLTFRNSCMHAACGSCGIRVNGREKLACDTAIASLRTDAPITVQPLANQRLVADLATDMVDFYAQFEAAGMPLVRAAEVSAKAEPPETVRAFGRFENCIECGLCLSACPISRTNRGYLGPAALAAAWRVVDEPRCNELGPVLALARAIRCGAATTLWNAPPFAPRPWTRRRRC